MTKLANERLAVKIRNWKSGFPHHDAPEPTECAFYVVFEYESWFDDYGGEYDSSVSLLGTITGAQLKRAVDENDPPLSPPADPV